MLRICVPAVFFFANIRFLNQVEEVLIMARPTGDGG